MREKICSLVAWSPELPLVSPLLPIYQRRPQKWGTSTLACAPSYASPFRAPPQGGGGPIRQAQAVPPWSPRSGTQPCSAPVRPTHTLAAAGGRTVLLERSRSRGCHMQGMQRARANGARARIAAAHSHNLSFVFALVRVVVLGAVVVLVV